MNTDRAANFNKKWMLMRLEISRPIRLRCKNGHRHRKRCGVVGAQCTFYGV